MSVQERLSDLHRRGFNVGASGVSVYDEMLLME